MELAEVVGSLSALQRFPIEPLAGETPNVAPVRGSGLLGDRAQELCDADSGEVIPLTASPLLLFFGARYSDDLIAENLEAWTRVRDPGGTESHLEDPAWREELGRLLKRRVVVRRRRAGPEDAPLRLISRATLRLAERTYGAPLENVRVRANLVIDLPEAKAFEEDRWTSRKLRIGDTLIEITGPAEDALVADYRPEIGRGDPDMLKGLLQIRQGRLGMCARVLSGLRIRAGDPLVLSDPGD
jgi:uncharacterized protein YcbX